MLGFPSSASTDSLKTALIVRTQRPHCAVHPSEEYTQLIRGRVAPLATADLTWVSLSKLQEQTIMTRS